MHVCVCVIEIMCVCERGRELDKGWLLRYKMIRDFTLELCLSDNSMTGSERLSHVFHFVNKTKSNEGAS